MCNAFADGRVVSASAPDFSLRGPSAFQEAIIATTSGGGLLVGQLGSYDVSSLDEVDRHLRALGIRLRTTMTDRQRTNARLDIDALLDARTAR